MLLCGGFRCMVGTCGSSFIIQTWNLGSQIRFSDLDLLSLSVVYQIAPVKERLMDSFLFVRWQMQTHLLSYLISTSYITHFDIIIYVWKRTYLLKETRNNKTKGSDNTKKTSILMLVVWFRLRKMTWYSWYKHHIIFYLFVIGVFISYKCPPFHSSVLSQNLCRIMGVLLIRHSHSRPRSHL